MVFRIGSLPSRCQIQELMYQAALFNLTLFEGRNSFFMVLLGTDRGSMRQMEGSCSFLLGRFGAGGFPHQTGVNLPTLRCQDVKRIFCCESRACDTGKGIGGAWRNVACARGCGIGT